MKKRSINRRGGLKGINLVEIVNSAVQEGINEIIEQHPRFSEQEELLWSYVDKKKINKKLQNYLSTQSGKTSLDIKDLVDDIANYVVSGDSFKEEGKEIILREGLREKSKKWWNFGAKKIFEGEKYLDETMASFRKLYNLFKTGDYSHRMPELSKAVAEVYDMGFADAAVNILYENGLLNNSKYKAFKRAINERAKQGAEYTQKALADYIISQRAAAAVLGIIGLGALLMNNSITGNVVGAGNPNIFGLLGGVLLVISAGLLWFAKKKQVKYKARK